LGGLQLQIRFLGLHFGFLWWYFSGPLRIWAIAIKYHDDYAAANIPMLPVVASKQRVYVEMWFHTIMMIVSSMLTIYFAGSQLGATT
jgi:protoheme IX farnesyltransferase